MKYEWRKAKNKRDLERRYKAIIPTVREVARASGYAIGVHGSLRRDLDLIAATWAKKCVKPATLAKRIEVAVCEYPSEKKYHYTKVRENSTKKPHGRLAFAIYIGPEAYIDLSVMPMVPSLPAQTDRASSGGA